MNIILLFFSILIEWKYLSAKKKKEWKYRFVQKFQCRAHVVGNGAVCKEVDKHKREAQHYEKTPKPSFFFFFFKKLTHTQERGKGVLT